MAITQSDIGSIVTINIKRTLILCCTISVDFSNKSPSGNFLKVGTGQLKYVLHTYEKSKLDSLLDSEDVQILLTEDAFRDRVSLFPIQFGQRTILDGKDVGKLLKMNTERYDNLRQKLKETEFVFELGTYTYSYVSRLASPMII